MKRKITLSFLSIAVLFIANSCATSTPATRIAKNPAMFEALPKSDKDLAQLGQIKRGMHKDGVLIAWGKPDGVTTGSRSGKSFEKWVYTTTSPVYTSSFRPFVGYGYGRFGCRGYGHFNQFDFGPEVHYVRQTAASVEFNQYNKVSEWMTRR